MKAGREHVQQEAAHELWGRERHGFVSRATLGTMVFPPERNAALVERDEPGVGLPVQLMSKVPNWGFPARYLIDFVRRTFRSDWDKFTAENSNEISL
jgi:hypothetical protein